MPHITDRQAFMHIMGAFPNVFPWYEASDANPAAKAAYDDLLCEHPERIAGWELKLYLENPDDSGQVTGIVNRDAIITACQAFASANPPQFATDAAIENARVFLAEPDMADFDAGQADEIIQYIVLGKIAFG